ncbi:MAG: amino acid-binding protein, partial [Methanobrevibacter sp.]|nr:amino acid-binding protein [Methanobrevibacter sp.]
MWEKLNEKFKKYPAKMNVAKKMIELGLRLGEDHKIYCADLKINDSSLAKAANVDRRAIKSTIEIILEDDELSNIFKNIMPAGTLLKNLAKNLGLGIIEIEPNQDSKGILAATANLILSKGISIRQTYATDTEIEE